VFVVLLVALLVVVVLASSAVANRAAGGARRDDERTASPAEETRQAAGRADPASEPTDPVTTGSPMSTDPWNDVGGTRESRPDPAGPPAVIHMVVTGTHPWAPVGVFLTELKAEGYETTVELPDLVVLRDDERLPVTVREPAGPPGHLIVTSTPELLARTLEILVRSLLTSAFTVAATDGRDVRLTDADGIEIRLTVTELALA
jgi:hypothetical protein